MSAEIGACSNPTYQRLCDLKKTGEIGRYGMLFSTQFKNYFYDTDTGKVWPICDYDFNALQAPFDPTISIEALEARCRHMGNERFDKSLAAIEAENLFCAPPVTAMHLSADDNRLNLVDTYLQQLVLE